MLAYVCWITKPTAVSTIGVILSIVLANIAYFTVFNSSTEFAFDVLIVYWEILFPALLLLLTKRIKLLIISPIISLIILYMLPSDMGVYLFAYYLSYNPDVFLWTPIIWVIGALTILTQRQESVGNGNDMSTAHETTHR